MARWMSLCAALTLGFCAAPAAAQTEGTAVPEPTTGTPAGTAPGATPEAGAAAETEGATAPEGTTATAAEAAPQAATAAPAPEVSTTPVPQAEPAVAPVPAPEAEPAAPPSSATGAEGPSIDLPPELASEAPASVAQAEAPSSTVIGGYGQLNLTSLKVGPDADFETRATVRRLVLFVSHDLSKDVRIRSELEWEDVMACNGCDGSVEVEQAFVDWRLAGDALALRTGLVLVPLGIINRWHEPPAFHGVERPALDRVVLPTTWRELGVGVWGVLSDVHRYELYVTTTLNPVELGPGGLAQARAFGSRAPADAFAVTGRFETEPILGATVGAAFFASDLGGNADFYSAAGRERDLHVPLLAYALDGRLHRWGFEAKLVWTQIFMPESDSLVASYRQDGSSWFPGVDETGAVATRIDGGQVELAYDVLHELATTHQLLAFLRLETYDTQAAVPDGFERNPLLDVDELTTGLSYRPIPQLVFKGDLQLRDRRLGYDELQLNAGVGYMF